MSSPANGTGPNIGGGSFTARLWGLIAIGNIGKRVAELARCFGMKVIAYDPYVSEQAAAAMGVRLVANLEELLSESDVISIHAPLTPETRHMISRPQIARMKDGAYIVNMGRGGIVDEEAAYEALKSGKLGGMGVDVMEQEPCLNSPLYELDNFIVTPHYGGQTPEALERMASIAAHRISRDDEQNQGVMELSFVRVRHDELRNLAVEILRKVGVPKEDAEIVANCLIEADLRGVQTHGVFHLPKYVARIQSGSLRAVTDISVISEAPSVALLDGGGGFGHVCGYKGMQMAIQKARETGIALVLVRNSNHFGMTAYYSMLALEAGQIGISMTNASPTMAPTGGVSPVLGNNPFSVAIPAGKWPPPVLDIAISASSLSKIKQAAERGTEIPLGWATDEEGIETTDAQKALRGLLLPIGGYKGYGLSFAIDALCGVLSGAAFGPFVGKHLQSPEQKAKPQDLGHAFIAVEVERFIPVEEYKARVDRFIDAIKTSRRAKGVEEIYYPGEKEHQTKANYLKNGIRIEKEIIEQVIVLSRALGLEMPLEMMQE